MQFYQKHTIFTNFLVSNNSCQSVCVSIQVIKLKMKKLYHTRVLHDKGERRSETKPITKVKNTENSALKRLHKKHETNWRYLYK